MVIDLCTHGSAAGRDSVAFVIAAEQRHICSQIITPEPGSYGVAK